VNEPVAWYVRFDTGHVELLAVPVSDFRRAMWESAGKRFTVQPLYAHPIAVSDAMVTAAIRAAFASGGGTAEGIARAALEAALAAREGA